MPIMRQMACMIFSSSFTMLTLMAVRQAVGPAVERARSGKGPALVVCDTYRWRGHSKSDRNRYRTQEEIDQWKEKDPIPRFASYAIERRLLTEEKVETIREESLAQIASSLEFAENSPEPSLDSIEEGVYAP